MGKYAHKVIILKIHVLVDLGTHVVTHGKCKSLLQQMFRLRQKCNTAQPY